MSDKYRGIRVVCKKEYPRLGLEQGDYFPTQNYTDEAIDSAIEKGNLEVEEQAD